MKHLGICLAMLASACVSTVEPRAYPSIKEAAAAAGRHLSHNKRVEQAALIMPSGEGYTWVYAGKGNEQQVTFVVLPGAVATVHTHVKGVQTRCSREDIDSLLGTFPNLRHYMANREGKLFQCQAK